MPEFMNEIQGFVAAFNAAGCTCQTCLNASNECQMSGGSCNPMAPVDGATPSAKCPMCIAALVADHQCPGVASGCSGANSCTNLLECIMKCADAGP
jgi:hypothetical protein